MSGYFAGFLFGSRLAPWLIGRVGHVRVFAALGSLISAALVLYALFPMAGLDGAQAGDRLLLLGRLRHRRELAQQLGQQRDRARRCRPT